MAKGPLKATDKRRSGYSRNVASQAVVDTNGAGPPLQDIFNDRRKTPNGQGKKAK